MLFRITVPGVAEVGPVKDLSASGMIPAAATTSFTVSRELAPTIAARLAPFVAAGDCTYFLRPDDNDKGAWVYCEELTIGHADLTAEALTQTIESAFTFPAGAKRLNHDYDLDEVFVGPGVDTPAEVQGNVGPFNIEPGQTLVVAVDGGAPATATFNATAAYNQTAAGPFNFRDQDTFTVAIDGGAPQTVTIDAGDVVSVDAVTKEELRDIINAQTTGCTAALDGNDVKITSDKKGTASRVVLANGIPAAAGAAEITGLAGPYDLAHNQTLIIDVNNGGNLTATFTGSAAFDQTKAATYNLEDGWTLQVKIDGGVTQTVTFALADFADIDAATALELAAVFNAQLVGCFATVVGGTDVRITSDRKGTGSRVQIMGGTAEAELAFDGETVGTGNVSNIDAVTEDEAKTVIEAAMAGVTVVTGGAGLKIQTNATGIAAELDVKAHTATNLGFSVAVTTGFAPALTILNPDGEVVGTGNVANIDAVTEDEAETVIEAAIAGVSVIKGDPGGLIIRTVATGIAAELDVQAHTAAGLGFAVETVNGVDVLCKTVTVDMGWSAGTADKLTDGASVGTGESTGQKFGSGVNAVPTRPDNMGGGKLRVKFTSNDNVINCSAGKLRARVYYIMT